MVLGMIRERFLFCSAVVVLCIIGNFGFLEIGCKFVRGEHVPTHRGRDPNNADLVHVHFRRIRFPHQVTDRIKVVMCFATEQRVSEFVKREKMKVLTFLDLRDNLDCGRSSTNDTDSFALKLHS